MAGRASQTEVRAGQRETGLLRVVESPGGPAHGVMAQLALRAERTRMNIFVRMTGPAVRRRIVKRRRRVALLACDVPVTADQRESHQVVIETDVCGP